MTLQVRVHWLFILAPLLLIPYLSNFILSPLVVILSSAVALLAVAVLVLTSNILFGLFLDRYYPSSITSPSPAPRTFRFSTPAAWQAAMTRSQWSYKAPSSLPPLLPDFPLVSHSLNDIMIYIVRDFVLSWYKLFSSSPSFPTALSEAIHSSLLALIARAGDLDFPEFLVRKILPIITLHIKIFADSEIAVRGATLERHLTRSDELDLLLASRYASSATLHPAIKNLSTMSTRQDEEAYFRRVLDRILHHLLPPREATKTIILPLREILACAVLAPIMESLADPDMWNRAIDQAAAEAIQQQKMISQVRQVLERGTRRDKISSTHSENITFATDVKRFEAFLRSIDRTNSLLDARRMKNDIMGEIRRTRVLLADHEDREWINGVKTETIVAFLDRLYTAKRHAENRIMVLGGRSEDPAFLTMNPELGGKQTLREILQNPSSLSYFMEFMDRRSRSQLVQFWLTVESFKDPLESLDDTGQGDTDVLLSAGSDHLRLRDDISMLLSLYFPLRESFQLLSMISASDIEIMRTFAGASFLASADSRPVRRAVLMSQGQVEKEMEQDFIEFRNSDLWFRAVKDLPTANHEAQAIVHGGIPNEPVPAMFPRPMDSTSTSSSVSYAPSGAALDLKGSLGSLSNLDLLMEPSKSSSVAKTIRTPLFEDSSHYDPILPSEVEGAEKLAQIQAALTDIIAHERFIDNGNSNNTTQHISRLPGEATPTNGLGFEEESRTADQLHIDEIATNVPPIPQLGLRTLRNVILQIEKSILDLRSQEAMLSALIRKAELTGDGHKLQLLAKSKRAMDREIRELHFQKDQYEQQEAENKISAGRTSVSIANATLQEEDGGKSFVRYLVEVRQVGPEGTPGTGWVVARRYNEFLSLHQKLKEEYLLVRSLDFPGKRLVTTISPAFIETRRLALEKYLQNLVKNSVTCSSEELTNFLSKDSPFQVAAPIRSSSRPNIFTGQSLVRNVYRSVTESIDDIFYGPSMLDVVIQSLTTQAAQMAGIVGASVNDEELVARAFKARADARSIAPEAQLMELSNRIPTLEEESSTSYFSAPICDFILAVFELDPKNNWLRRQAIVIILQQVLGSTIERKVRDMFKLYCEESQILSFINLLKDDVWPKGQLNTQREPRSFEERTQTRRSANQKLSTFMPDLVASMLGRSNARRGARRIFSVLQNRRLNQHLLYTILDEVIQTLFPEEHSDILNPT